MMGLPSTADLAKPAGVVPVDVKCVSNNARVSWQILSLRQSCQKITSEAKLAGNGMDVPCVGFVLLAVIPAFVFVMLSLMQLPLRNARGCFASSRRTAGSKMVKECW